MPGRKKTYTLYENITITDAGAEGKAVARIDNMVVFVPFAVPGDVVDIRVFRKKKNFLEGRIERFQTCSPQRVDPICGHFGTCGGCSWQHMNYNAQLFYKQKQVEDHLQRIAKVELPPVMPIIPSAHTIHYRNKLEFTFSNRRWFTEDEIKLQTENQNRDALGFHLPGMYDRVLDIENCYLQAEPSNEIRRRVKEYAIKHQYSFNDARNWTGFLRILLIRNTTAGDLMVNVVFSEYDEKKVIGLMQFIKESFPVISSLIYTINSKKNDDISGLETFTYHGNPFIVEHIPSPLERRKDLKFKIGPVSFFQTNPRQAAVLYKIVFDFATLKGDETVYDLYTGAGIIANYIAGKAARVIGIEYNEAAIRDARENAQINGLNNTIFFAGDIARVLDEPFVAENGQADLIITDPPRAGMHEKVVKQILKTGAEKIVYVSCNSATQARDIALLDEKYKVMKIQPIDMFPHTQHVENVILLAKKQ